MFDVAFIGIKCTRRVHRCYKGACVYMPTMCNTQNILFMYCAHKVHIVVVNHAASINM